MIATASTVLPTTRLIRAVAARVAGGTSIAGAHVKGLTTNEPLARVACMKKAAHCADASPPDRFPAMRWELSDGTVVHLGGQVEGDSRVAKFLARDLDVRNRRRILLHPIPCGDEPLDPNNPYHVRETVHTAVRCLGVALVSEPDLPMRSGTPPKKPDPKLGPVVN